MKLSIKNINSLIQQGAQTNKLAYNPTPFDYHPNQISLVHEFFERELLSIMYKYINYIDVPKLLDATQDGIKYKESYVSFLLFLSTPTSEIKHKDDVYKNIVAIKELFYKEILSSCLIKISPILKTIFYRYYNGVSIPKLKIMKKEKNKNFLTELIASIKKKTMKEKKIEETEEYFNKYIESIYIQSDEFLCDYITDWIKMKLDFFAADLVLWRQYKIQTDPRYISLQQINMNDWGEADVLKDVSSKTYDVEKTRLINALVSEAESDLFINKLKSVFDSSNYMAANKS